VLSCMSLYRAREWWSTSCGHEEEYETRSLVIGSIDSSSSEQGATSSFEIAEDVPWTRRQHALCR